MRLMHSLTACDAVMTMQQGSAKDSHRRSCEAKSWTEAHCHHKETLEYTVCKVCTWWLSKLQCCRGHTVSGKAFWPYPKEELMVSTCAGS